jgi:glutathione S-transferase
MLDLFTPYRGVNGPAAWGSSRYAHVVASKPKLYVILGSHACRTGMLLMEHKGIEYRPVELPTGLHPFLVRLRGFAGNPAPFRHVDDDRPHRMLAMADRFGTVPALLIDGQRVQTNRKIARFLDRVHPDPPLFPSDPDQRRAIEEAERWGDEVFQMVARRLVLAARLGGRDTLINRADDGRLGPLLFRSQRLRLFATQGIARFFGVDAAAVKELPAALPGMLDRIDGWIDAGVLNGNELNAADFMIAPSVALLTYRHDLRAEIERRPVIRLVDRLLPEPSSVPQPIAA